MKFVTYTATPGRNGFQSRNVFVGIVPLKSN
jgi:hypothetical protein